jgi:hypothetical protein
MPREVKERDRSGPCCDDRRQYRDAGERRLRCAAGIHGGLRLAHTGQGAALGHAPTKAIILSTQRQRLTVPPNGAQHTEKAVVFVYSKVKVRVPSPGAGLKAKWNVTLEAQRVAFPR